MLRYDLSQALEQFSEDDREIILRYYYYYQTAPMIAKLKGLETENVKSRVRRARKKLISFLKERGYGI